MTQQPAAEFSKWRSILWPIHTYELKKVLPMFFMFFCISFNYTVLRDTKDALIVTAAGSGAEAIPFLKVWCVVPAAVIYMVIYSQLSNALSREKLFYTALAPFIIFFALFPTVIYPNRELLHPTTSADALAEMLPAGLSGLIAIYRNWSYALFYVLAELWGSVALSLLFWGFANQITRVSEAKRFYAPLGVGANIALLVSGPAIIYTSRIREKVPAGVDPWGVSLNLLMGMVVICAICVMALYWYMNRSVLTDPRFYDPTEVKTKKSKPKMSFGDSMRYLFSSPYILCLAALVISYGIAINIVEVTWKGQMKMQYPNPNDYNAFMGTLSTVTGFITVIMMLFVGGNLLRKKGWGITAMVTPIMLGITGILFFVFIFCKDTVAMQNIALSLGTSPLFMIVIAGLIQNVASKSCKYSMFDPTKEMAYIPLDQEQKTKGKAAIDVVGARLGKSGGSILQQVLIVSFGSLAAITPYLFAILVVVFAGWMLAARSLNSQLIGLIGDQALGEDSKKQAAPEPVTTEAATAT